MTKKASRDRHVLMRILSTAALVVLTIPVALPAAAGPYGTIAVHQTSGTPSPPATGDSPFASCDVSTFYRFPSEVNYLNSEVEPFIAVNPTDPTNLIGVYQQDRWSGGSARGLVAAVSHDGGLTWTATYPRFSICGGGTAANGGYYERATDPWVTFSPNGDAYFSSLSINFVGDATRTEATAILVSKSTDGGDHWSAPITLVQNRQDIAPYYFNDKETVTADPFDPDYVYAVWTRFRKPGDAKSGNIGSSHAIRGDTLFSRTTDGGQTWEPHRTILGVQKNFGTLANQIVVLPDRTLVNIFDAVQGSGANFPGYYIMVQRSTDLGETWSDPIEVAPERAVPAFDPETGVPIRAPGFVDIAVDLNPASPSFGNLYAVWGDSFGSGTTKKTRHGTIVFSQSTDGGLTWSSLARIDRSPPGVQAHTPSVDVAADGTVGVTYYDFRNNTPDPGLATDYWMIHCDVELDCPAPTSWTENHVAGPFDMARAPVAGGYFIGDYEGLTSIGNTFIPFFIQTTSSDSGNAYLARVAP